MFYSLITIPQPSDVFATTAVYSSAMFNELLTPALVVAGCLIAGTLVVIIVNAFLGAFDRIRFKREIDHDFDTMSVEELNKKYNKD